MLRRCGRASVVSGSVCGQHASLLKMATGAGETQLQDKPISDNNNVAGDVAPSEADHALKPTKPCQCAQLPTAQIGVENDASAGNGHSGLAPGETQDEVAVKPGKAGLGVSDYEEARKLRMQENLKKLRSLGLSGGVADIIGVPAPSSKRPSSKRKNELVPPDSAQLRRSTRASEFLLTFIFLHEVQQLCAELVCGGDCYSCFIAGVTVLPTLDEKAHAVPQIVPEPEEIFISAPWLGPETALLLPSKKPGIDRDDAWSTPLLAEDDLDGFHALHCTMSSSELKGIYSLSWYGRLLLAAGKGGICSLFSVPEVLLILHSCASRHKWMHSVVVFAVPASGSCNVCCHVR
jgi:hypothetical protein